jgi:hypothetical protein
MNASPDRDLDRFLGAVVDDRQTPDRPAIGQRIEHEVHRPGGVRARRHLQRPALDRDALAFAALAHRLELRQETLGKR